MLAEDAAVSELAAARTSAPVRAEDASCAGKGGRARKTSGEAVLDWREQDGF